MSNIPVNRYTIQSIRFKPFHFAFVLIGSLLYFITPLVAALFVREIFNKLQGYSTTIELDIWTLVILLALINIAQLIIDVAWAIVMIIFFFSERILFRKNMLAGIFKQPGALPLPESSGEAISRFRRDVEETSFFAIAMADLLSFCLFGIIALFLMFSINPEVTFFVFLPFTIAVIIVNVFRNKLTTLRRERRKATGIVTGTINEIFSSISSIKVASAEANVLRHFREVNRDRGEKAIKDEFFGALLSAIRILLISSAIGIMLLLISHPMQTGAFTVGDFALFIYLLEWVTGFVNYLGESIARYFRTKVSYERMIKLMQGTIQAVPKKDIIKHRNIYLKDDYPTIHAPSKESNDFLQFMTVNDLSYQFPNSTRGIFDINLEIKKGTLNVITGRVGSGKTTLLRAILGLLPKDSGEIRWNGSIIKEPHTFFIPPRAAYTAQVPSLFSDSIQENLLFGIEESNNEIENSLRLAVVDTDVSGFEKGIDTIIGPKGIKLSGGQKQRLAAARMFLRHPELVVFDDLSSALDVETEERLWDQLFEESSSRTYLVVSHRPAVLKRADNIVVLKNGKIVGQGKLDGLDNCEEMQNLWEGDD